MRLTAKKVETLKTPGRYADGYGLYLQVVSPNNKSWLLRYERAGRERMMGLGPLRDISLKKARERASAARQLLLDGIDPLEARLAAEAARALEFAKAVTFAKAAEQYFDQHERKWRNQKHRAQFTSTLKTYAYASIGHLTAAAVDTGLVLKVLEQPVRAERGYPAGSLWEARPETASRLRGRIEAVLDWATVRGYRKGENPARWKGHLENVLPARAEVHKATHHAALPYVEIQGFLSQVRERGGVAAQALEFTILTAARTGETIGAIWDEVDLVNAIWTIPAGRMKGRREHRVPLSDKSLSVLEALPREPNNNHVFIGLRKAGLSNMAMAKLLSRMGRHDITVHGFRSAFRDWAAEQTNHPNHVVEMALAHVVSNKVEAAYRRGDLLEKRRRLMSEWAVYCSSTAKTGDVLPFPRST